ncbi:hypothetical protein MRB53_003311 [Persea americana]|uniref:Uncharacterized protein n=1 Tax=Persea americana TaxID=3435 RepID=A0ACC2MXA8_PERAE|nr:hypothetical protein MRB53_003311 [Persea americana]
MDRQSKVSDYKKERSSSWPKSAGPSKSQPSPPESSDLGSEGPNDAVIALEIIASNSWSSSASFSSSGSSDSCVESYSGENHGHKKSPGADVACLILRGCIRCHMYVMLQKQNPRCPRCSNSSDLVSFFHE